MFLSGKKVHDVHTDVRKNPNSTVATIASTLFTPRFATLQLAIFEA